MRDDIRLGEQLTILPGQIWLAEQAAGENLFPIDQAAFAEANVIIYDRALTDRVAEMLTLGTYAEPMSALARSGAAAISPRALHFAAEGWSVVQLVERSPQQRQALRAGAGALRRAGWRPEAAVTAIAKHPMGALRRDEASLDELGRLIDEANDDFLTLVFGPLAPVPAAVRQGYLFTANGLAG